MKTKSAKLYLAALSLLLALTPISFGQDKAVLKQKLEDNSLISFEAPSLWWIKTPNDFSQANLTIEEIDLKIDAIISKQTNKPVIDIETPINLKKLKYYGYLDVNKIGIIGNAFLLTDSKTAEFYENAVGARNIFQYGNIKILGTYNSYEDQLNVYSIIRAVLILKNKYPEIYRNLFTATEISPLLNDNLTKDLPQSDKTVLNINKNYVFSIHQNQKNQLSATYSSLSAEFKDSFLNRLVSDNNTHLIFLNKDTIRNGGAATGANPVYKNQSKQDAQIKFLFDGLIQTVVHERLHDYLTNQMTLNAFFNYIKTDQTLITNKTACENSTYLCIEEPIVTNTTNKLFDKEGGISKDVMGYYKDLFENTQIPLMKNNTDFANLISQLKKLNKKSTGNAYPDVLVINF